MLRIRGGARLAGNVLVFFAHGYDHDATEITNGTECEYASFHR